MSDKISVAIIGGGRTGTPLLKELLKYTYIEIVGVADLDPNAEGIKLAAAKGIFTTSDPMELIMKGGFIDILVEVSGDNNLKRTIKSEFERSGNTRTIIMHDLIARLFISVCTQQQQLVSSLHPQDVGVGS
jgi:acetaldehyde dehydrogenase (acetylating)